MNITIPELEAQWNRAIASNLAGELIRAAVRHGLPMEFLPAIASRETNMRNELGDGNHGVGPVQIDTRFHPIAAEAKSQGWWQTNPAPLIDFGAALLASTIARAQTEFPGLAHTQYLRFAASAYNAGYAGAIAGHRDGDCDDRTTGGDYGADVMERAGCLSGMVYRFVELHPWLRNITPAPEIP